MVPTVGRIVHYYTMDDTEAKENQAEILPALVVQTWSEEPEGALNLSVHTFNAEAPVVLRGSVPHKMHAVEGKPYWVWPPIPAAKKPDLPLEKNIPLSQQY